MQNSKERRKKHFVDPQVQSAILRQGAYYWLFGTLIYLLVVTVFRIIPYCFTNEGITWTGAWFHLAPMVISSAVLLPVVIISAIRFSHRFVGPMLRFRQVLRKLASGERAPQINLRQLDFWTDVARDSRSCFFWRNPD